jgi:hypothetical protein
MHRLLLNLWEVYISPTGSTGAPVSRHPRLRESQATSVGKSKDFLEIRPRHTIPGMRTKIITPDPSAEIWQRVVEFRGDIAPSAARALLKIGFSDRDHALMAELSAKARIGRLTTHEQTILDTFERLGCLLDIVHSKARQSLKKKPKKAS